MQKLILTLLALLIFSSPTKAVKEYATKTESTYELIGSNTLVTHTVNIKNNLANIYTTSYAISIGSNNLSKIKIKDETGEITPKITQNQASTTINIPIDNPVIGKDEVKQLEISYLNPDIAQHQERIWELNIPKLSNANELVKYTRKLIVPNTLPPLSYSIPKPQTSKTDNSRIYTWENNQTSSITMFFGEFQLYSLNLNYHISNPTIQENDTEIALPPDTEYQKIYLQNISPEPKEIKTDKDGNWLAIYSLKPREEKEIQANLTVKIYPQPHFLLPNLNPDFQDLTKPTKFWQTNTNNIKTLAQQLETPKNIHQYITNNFTYNYERVKTGAERLGAKQALEQPTQSICTEFTDTFIALARAIDIPAREINGYAFTTNQKLRPLSLETDVLHAWPQYYDTNSQRWIQIDPTWQNTTGGINYFSKLDFNHITFVIHGQEANYPYPAGAYKRSAEEKSVEVKIAKTEPRETIDIKTQHNPAQNTFTVTNLSNIALTQHKIQSPDGTSLNIEYLPPYGVKKFDLKPKTPSFQPKSTHFIYLIPVILIPLAYFVFKKIKLTNK